MSSGVPIIEMPPPSSRGGWTRSRVVFLAISAVVVVAILSWAHEVLLPFILALIIAYVLTPLVALCERVRIPRALAIILVYATTFSTLYFSIAAIAPRVYDEAAQLSREAPNIGRNLAERWAPVVEKRLGGLFGHASPPPGEPQEVPEPGLVVTKRPDGSFAVDLRSGVEIVQETSKRWRVQPLRVQSVDWSAQGLIGRATDETAKFLRGNALELIKVGQVIVSKVSRGIFLLFMTLMVAGYLMHTRDDIVRFLRSLPPANARTGFDRLMHRIDRGLSGVVRGQLVICLVNGVLSAIGFWLFGLKYWPILAIIAGMMSIIPIFGSILSSIPAVAIGLTQDFWTALWVLLWILGIHQVEANLLNPNIIGVAAKVHPVLVVFSLFVGEHFFGLWGALLAVPALSLLQSIFLHFRYESMPDAGPDSLLPIAPKKG